MGRKHKKSAARGILRSLYRALGVVNTLTYIVSAGARPGALVKHLARKKTSKVGGRLIK